MPAFEVLALDTATPQIRAPGAGDTYTFPRAITPSGANVTPFTVSGYSLTGANAQSLVDLSGTWNTSGTPTALKLNITDTASNAASLLMDLQVGGVSRFSVSKSGAIGVSNISLTGFVSGATFVATNQLVLDVANQDVVLRRDAANTLAQRNGTNAQTFRVYNTFTDASNYERLSVDWSSNVAYIRPQNAGTGSARIFVPVTGATTVAGLPAAATAGAGARAFVTDANATTFLSTVAGGGANKVPVVSDGTNWLIG